MNFDFSALNFETIDSNINAYPAILARRFYCPHSRFTLKLSQNAAAHP